MKGETTAFILKEGMVISTKLGANPAWYQNVVYKCEGNIIYIGLLDRYLENCVFADTSIILKHTNEYYEYLFDGVVLDIQPGEYGYIVVKIHRADERVNVRWFPRFDTHLPMSISPAWNDAHQYSIVTNLSLVGIAFISKYSFDVHDETTAAIHLPDNNTAHVKGKFLRKVTRNHYYEYGMNFTEMTEHNNNLLSSYLSSLEEKRTSLQDYFFEHIKNRI